MLSADLLVAKSARARFVEQLQALMTARGLDQVGFAREMKRSEAWVSFLLNRKRGTNLATIDDISDHFGLDPSYWLPPENKSGTKSEQSVNPGVPLRHTRGDKVRLKGGTPIADSTAQVSQLQERLAAAEADCARYLGILHTIGAALRSLPDEPDSGTAVPESPTPRRPAPRRRAGHRSAR